MNKVTFYQSQCHLLLSTLEGVVAITGPLLKHLPELKPLQEYAQAELTQYSKTIAEFEKDNLS